MKTKVWLPAPPTVEGPYILVGCPPGIYTYEDGKPDLFNSPDGSIQTIDKRLVGPFVEVRAKSHLPLVFADRSAYAKAGYPYPGTEDKPATPSNEVAQLQGRIDLLTTDLANVRSKAAQALDILRGL